MDVMKLATNVRINRGALGITALMWGASVLVGCSEDQKPSAPSQAGQTRPVKRVAAPELPEIDKGMGTKPARSDAAANPPGWRLIEFEPAVMDFGQIPPGQRARGTVKLWNVGPTPLTIGASATSCGCTAAEDLRGRVIQPGAFTQFTVSMLPKSGTGEKREGVRIAFGPDDPVVEYQLLAEVVLPIRADPPYIQAAERSGSGWINTLSGTITLDAADGQSFRILATAGRPPQFVDFDPRVDQPRSRYTLRWDLAGLTESTMPWWWVVETDRPDCPVVDVRVRHQWTLPERPSNRAWQPRDQRVLAGTLRAGDEFEFITDLEWPEGMPVNEQVTGIVSESAPFSARLVQTEVDGHLLHCTIRIEVSDGPEGLLYGTMRLHTARSGCPLTVIGRRVK